MSKYEPLTTFLKAKFGREVRMTFAEIEEVTGQKLPTRSKAIRAWWSNNPSNNVLTRAWLDAGYKSAQVDIAGERLTFVPTSDQQGFSEMKLSKFSSESAKAGETAGEKQAYRHPAWGTLKGMITIPADVDLTAPAYEDWKKLYGEHN